MHTNTPDAHSLSRRSTVTQSWRKSFKLHRILSLAVFNIVCNVAILCAVFHTFRFGAFITNESWWITDNNLLSVIEFTAKLPAASTVFIGGLAASRLWSSNLEDALSAAGITEPQSLNVFSSVLAIPRVVSYIIQSRYVSARKPYLLIVLSAILLRFYSTAIVTLLTPALTFVQNPTATYQFTELPFMTQPGYGNRCNLPYISGNEVQSCLQIMLAGSALVELLQRWQGTSPALPMQRLHLPSPDSFRAFADWHNQTGTYDQDKRGGLPAPSAATSSTSSSLDRGLAHVLESALRSWRHLQSQSFARLSEPEKQAMAGQNLVRTRP